MARRYYNAKFSLATGTMEPCYFNKLSMSYFDAHWTIYDNRPLHTDNTCKSPVYFDEPYLFDKIAGQMYGSYGDPTMVSMPYEIFGNCTSAYNNAAGGPFKLWLVQPLPDWFAHALQSGAPYTLNFSP